MVAGYSPGLTVWVRLPDVVTVLLGAADAAEVPKEVPEVPKAPEVFALAPTGMTSVSPTRMRSEVMLLAALIARTDVSY